MEEVAKAIPVFLSSALKFILGPIEGYALHLHAITTMVATVCGMMLSVVAFTYFGDWLRHRIMRRWYTAPDAPPKKRWYTDFLQKYGLTGIAILTPLILTPIGGTILAVGLGKPKGKIVLYMLISAIFWSLVLTYTTYAIGRLDVPGFLK